MSVAELRTPLPAHPRPEAPDRADPAVTRRWRPRLPAAIVLGSLALAALTLLLPTAPTYDPWAWIVWGREVTQLDLVTDTGPSWKPLPVLFTTAFAPFGAAAPELWVWIARAGAIAALPVAYLLAARLAGRAAGLAAVAALVVTRPWLFNGAMGNSEGLLVALALGAVLLHAEGRRGWAFALAVGVGLLRPEAWPFLGLYGLWLLRGDLRRAPWVVGAGALVVALWLGPELWGSGNAFRAADRAQQPNAGSAAFADLPWLEVVKDAIGMLPWLAVAGLGAAAVTLRREPLALGLAAVGAGWLGLVALMTSGGFSGNQRYLVLPAAIAVVLGAAGIVRLLARLRVPAAAALAVVPLAFLAPDAATVPETLREVRFQTALVEDLEALPRARCGPLVTGPRLVPAVAWTYGVHAREVLLEPPPGAPATVLHVRVKPELPRAPGAGSALPGLAERGAWKLRCAA